VNAKNPKAVTIESEAHQTCIDEAERSLHDGLCVVRNVIEDGKIVAGGGAPEAELAKNLRAYASKLADENNLRSKLLQKQLKQSRLPWLKMLA
jgi:chaperonin GroEL (HSP60 family)